MKTKKLILGVGFSLLGMFVHAQTNGLEGIRVEKYYITTAADSIQADKDVDDYNANNGTSLPHGTLRVGAITYRLYADMLPGYKILQTYGNDDKNQILKITTTTTFYNNPAGTSSAPSASKAALKNNLLALDSYISLGGVATGQFGIPKADDNGALNNVTTAGNTGGVLLNNDTIMGIPLTTQDGMISGSGVQGISPAGFDPDAELAINQAESTGNSFIINNGSWFTTAGAVGPVASTNKVLLGQFTTDGGFHYEINVLIGTPAGLGEYYVFQNPDTSTGNDERTIPSLKGDYNFKVTNLAPTATITAPANGTDYHPGDAVAIAADATDTDGTVASVEFFVDGTSIGTDNSAPFTANYTATTTLGTHAITAKAKDNLGLVGAASAVVNINVSQGNLKPSAPISSPADNSVFVTGASVAITSNATDPDGTVASVEFFVDGTSIGVDNTAPFTASYVAVAGTHNLTAKATDNQGLTGDLSSPVKITVNNNIAPIATVTAPNNGDNYFVGSVVAIAATASDADGSVASVEFFVDGTSVGVDNTAPYTATYTTTAGSHAITAKATDNLGLTGLPSAAVNINVISAGAPYAVGTTTDVCSNPSFCLPIIAIDTVKDVIGYDLTVKYNPAKVHATGNVTINPALINPTYASYAVNNDAVAGSINISVYLNGTAPATAAFNGVGQLVCVEFTKDASMSAVDTALFSVPTLQESYVTGVAQQLAAAGKYINKKNTAYEGSLKFWTDNSPIQYDAANPSQYLITNIYGTDGSCGNKSATAVQPDLAGKFSYNILNGSSISIERDIDPLTNVQPVINSMDANLANKVLVNDLSFIPNIFQAIALDVNTDGVISAGDVSQINQRSADVIHEFKQKWNYSNNGTSNGQLSKDWLFLDSALLASPAYKISTSYPSSDGTGFSKSKVPMVPFCLAIPTTGPTTCATYDQTAYKGVLLGDVNGNYDAVPHDGKLKREGQISQDGTVYLNLDQATAGAGYIDIPLSFVSTDKIVGIDLALQFNESNLSYNSINPKVDYFTDKLGNYWDATKTLKVTANSVKQNLEADKNLIAIRFNTLNGTISNKDLYNFVGYLNGNQVKAELKGNITTGISTSDNSVSVQVYPNPASSVINILAPERAVVELMDLQGRQVMISTMVNANQKQEISTENLANGTYMLKVYNENFVSTQRIIIDNNK